ncbi:MAG TPA: putative protein N(5)-glutamine methyltransferase [Nocardioidaceae bacterium]|nr:putative protein N(5)-glutamine methyltransferase [Nocardioidaceae bacterium]
MSVEEVASRLRAAGCVFAEDEAALILAEAHDGAEAEEMVGRRVDGTPLEHILGWAEFCGLRVRVAPGVFVPRRRTQLLARRAVELLRPSGIVVELCSGAAAVSVAIATARPGSEVFAADLDPVAVRCARDNLVDLGGHVFEGDLYDALPGRLRGHVDMLVANAPYVPTDAVALMPPEARDHEPRLALDGGPDGLDVAGRIVADAADWLAPTGTLLVETGTRQVAELVRRTTYSGLIARALTDDELDATALEASPTGRTGGA